jgi:hypothetical protein
VVQAAAAAWGRQRKTLAQKQTEASMQTKTAARCASLLLLGVLLTSCIGPGLEPPGGERASDRSPGPSGPARPAIDAGSGPTDGFGNSGGETMSPNPTEMPDTSNPDPQTPPPTSPPSEMDDDADAGTDMGDESP